LPTLVFEGTVFSGEGRGKKYVELPWFKGQTKEKLGFFPYPGTLNVCLKEKDVEKRRVLETAEGLTVEPQTGYYSGVLFKAIINGVECAVVIPIMPNYPSDVLEIIAPVYLRDSLNLVDGSFVTVVVIA
jgi:riboflavin kinase, archaea type